MWYVMSYILSAKWIGNIRCNKYNNSISSSNKMCCWKKEYFGLSLLKHSDSISQFSPSKISSSMNKDGLQFGCLLRWETVTMTSLVPSKINGTLDEFTFAFHHKAGFVSYIGCTRISSGRSTASRGHFPLTSLRRVQPVHALAHTRSKAKCKPSSLKIFLKDTKHVP
jgi:hypothetical protein